MNRPAGWEERRLGDLFRIKHGYAFEGKYFAASGPFILLTPGNFYEGGGFNRRDGKEKFYDGPVPNGYVLNCGDLLVAMTEQAEGLLGSPAIVPESGRYLHNQRLGLVTELDEEQIDKTFLYYLLNLRHVRDQIRATATGTKVRHTAPSRIYGVRACFPPVVEQKKIAHVLGTLDDKIELNRQMNQTLEQIAAALFKSWFVDFDPVRAKAAGRQPEGLDAQTAALFPDRLVDSEMGEIPEGWSRGAFTETVSVLSGGTPSTREPAYWGGTIPWYSVVDAPSTGAVWVLDTERKITELGLENSAAQLLPIATTIISARGTVGKLALTAAPMAMNQSCYGLISKDGGSPSFTYFTTSLLVGDLQQRSHGSVFDTITRSTLDSVEVIMPTRDVVAAFESTVDPFMSRILNNLQQNQTLASLRDTLLPRLLSGELRVPWETLDEEAVTVPAPPEPALVQSRF